jgi:hypothetical protein
VRITGSASEGEFAAAIAGAGYAVQAMEKAARQSAGACCCRAAAVQSTPPLAGSRSGCCG